jgi:hypothetical protein
MDWRKAAAESGGVILIRFFWFLDHGPDDSFSWALGCPGS